MDIQEKDENFNYNVYLVKRRKMKKFNKEKEKVIR